MATTNKTRNVDASAKPRLPPALFEAARVLVEHVAHELNERARHCSSEIKGTEGDLRVKRINAAKKAIKDMRRVVKGRNKLISLSLNGASEEDKYKAIADVAEVLLRIMPRALPNEQTIATKARELLKNIPS